MKPMRRKPKGEMNKAEARYAQDLELLKRAGKILDWKYEAIKFKLADKTYYTPDFLLVYPDKFVIIELKGYTTGRMAHSIVKFKVARQMYPWFDWKMIMLNRWGGQDHYGMVRVKIDRKEEKGK